MESINTIYYHDNSQNKRGVFSRIKRIFVYLKRRRTFIRYDWTDAIIKPIHLTPSAIEMHEHVLIYYHARILGVDNYGSSTFHPHIIFNKGVSVQQNLHLTCAESVIIGENTAIAANVSITDIHHPYENIDVPIEKQELRVKPVIIGADCKINNNVVVLPGTIIGKHCVIGANAVVSGVFPDYCVIVGIPARIVKRYDFGSKQWKETDKNGDFLF